MSVSDFRELRDDELAKRSDDELIDYMRKARAAGAQAAGRQALSVLVWGHVGNVRRRMALRLPSYAVEDAAHDALVRAIGSAFDGTSVGQFRSWLSTITNRTIADFYRYRERHPDPDPLGGGREGEDEGRPGFEPAVGSEDGAVEMQVVIDEVMGELNEDHRRVIELHVFGALTAKDVCSQMGGMSPDNVAQIASRFRTRLREELGRGGSL